MFRFVDIRIRPKLIFLFLATGIIPLTLVGLFGTALTVDSLMEKSFSILSTVQEIHKRQIETVIEERFGDIEILSDTQRVRDILENLESYADAVETRSGGTLDTSTSQYLDLHGRYSKSFKSFIAKYNYHDLFIIDSKYGHVLFSSQKGDDLGSNLSTGSFKDSNLAELWRKVVKTGNTTVVDYEAYEPRGGIQSAFIGTPIRDLNDTVVGVLAVQMQPDFITSIMNSREGLGETGESYIVNWDQVTDLFELRSNLLTMGDGQYVVGHSLGRKLDYFVDAAAAGVAGGQDSYTDSEGDTVLVAFDKLDVPGLNWFLISKIDQYEVTAPIRNIMILTILVAGFMVLLIAVGAWMLAKTLTRPIVEDMEFAQAISEGHLDTTISLDRKDEFGQLAGALNTMASTLHDQHWLKSGKEGLDDEMRGEHETLDLAKRFVRFFVSHMGAELGALYIKHDDVLELLSSHSFIDREGNFNSFKVGEGMVGQAALENKVISFVNVADGAPGINYGAGETTPPHYLIVPISFEGLVIGVLLLGSITPFTGLQREFVDQNTENSAILFNAAKSRETIRVLLETSHQQQKELHLTNEELEDQAIELKESEAELQAQQEELRVSNEELEEQTKALKESETALQAQQEELRVTNEELEGHTQTLENQKDAIRKKNADLVKSQEVVKQKARDLEIASKYKSEFLANMSHELRTPLNSILILSQLFGKNKGGNLTDKQIESANAIHSSGSDLLTLINEILDLSKVEAGKIELVIEDIPVEDMVSDINRLFKDVAADKGVGFDISVADEMPATVRTDSQRLQQVLRNLLTNAFKFTREGTVSIDISRPRADQTPEWLTPDTAVSFAVRDQGIGIPDEQQAAIFEAFQQADGSTSRKYGGTGLGLSISKELAKLLGGAIYLESAEGTGSTFTVVLPEVHVLAVPVDEGEKSAARTDAMMERARFSQSTETSATASTQPKAAEVSMDEKRQVAAQLPGGQIQDDRKSVSREDKSLLVIEDDVNFSKVMRDFARERGFKCIVAEDGETGLHFADYYKPSAIILDIGLPGIDGWTVMERLKDNPDLRHIPVHFMSAADSSLDAMRMGAVGFLSKPVSMEKIEGAFSRIEDVISKPVSKLLVVEDDDIQRDSIQQLIGDGDVDTTAVATGTEAFDELNKGIYDCMILDLGLSDMSGFDLLEKIRSSETMSRVPIIIYTGRDLTQDEEKELNTYAESIIIKGAKSPERLLDESALFLHRVESELPADKQQMLKMVHDKEAVLSDKTILLVDDDMRNVFALSSVLEEKSMEVVIARNGLEAIEKLNNNGKVDLVLMDIMMPQMDGYEAMQEIRKDRKHANLPIIALTAKAMKGDRSKCIDAGANDYLAKPVNTDKLLSMLRVWLY